MRAQVTSMQGMAEKYRATQEENRRLYNEVQDLKGNIRVFCRVRPPGATGDGSASAPAALWPTRQMLLHDCIRCPPRAKRKAGLPLNFQGSTLKIGIQPKHPAKACTACAGCTEIGEDGELALYNPRSGMRKQFKYDRVFGAGSSQEEVYEDTKALIRSVLDGEPVPALVRTHSHTQCLMYPPTGGRQALGG